MTRSHCFALDEHGRCALSSVARQEETFASSPKPTYLGFCAAHSSRASSADTSPAPWRQSVFHLRRDLRVNSPLNDAVTLQIAQLLESASFSEMPGIARCSSEKRSTPRSNSWKMMTIFQRPSRHPEGRLDTRAAIRA